MGGIKPDFLREEDDEFEVSTTAEEKITKKPRGKPSKKRQYKVRLAMRSIIVSRAVIPFSRNL